ncbi:MAG: DUF2804 domain-containing protein [Proteobacteria bacterium]|nr:DUF2804 domain-containing protein [Pseudomonadota bacterium]
MNRLIKPDGRIDFGIIDNPIDSVNYKDFNLESPMGRKKSGLAKILGFNQFNFIGIMGPDFMAGLAVVDLKYLSNGFFYIYNRQTNDLVETKKLAPPFSAFVGTNPSRMDSRFSFSNLKISIEGNRITARGKDISLEAVLDLDNVNPLRICTRAGYRGWVYTEKTSPVPLSGQIRCHETTWDLTTPGTMALVDWSAGFMRRNTYWNWAASASVLNDGRTIGINLASGVNETGFTENAVWIDNTMIKIDTVNFIFEPDNLMATWQIRSFDGKINLEFKPENKREEKTNAMVLASRFTQLMGCFQGTLTTDSGEIIHITDLPGYTEDHYAKW